MKYAGSPVLDLMVALEPKKFQFIRDRKAEPIAESRAEAVSYLVLKHFGVDQPWSPIFVANQGASEKRLEPYKQDILGAAEEILTACA